MSRTLLLLCLCGLASSPGVFAEASAPAAADERTSGDQAAAAYARGDSAAAVAGFEALIRERGYSAPLLHDLAVAQLAAGTPAAAIESLERARMLSPRDPRITARLDEARQQLGVTPPTYSDAEAAAGQLSLREWTLVGIGGVLIAALGLVALGWSPVRAGCSLGALAAGVVIAGLSVAAVDVAWLPLSRAVVLEDGAVARKSPFEQAQPRFALPEGDLVTVEKRHGDYAYVRTRRGDAAWVPQAALGMLVPQPAPAASKLHEPT